MRFTLFFTLLILAIGLSGCEYSSEETAAPPAAPSPMQISGDNVTPKSNRGLLVGNSSGSTVFAVDKTTGSVTIGTTGSISEETNTMTLDDGDGLPITLQEIRDATGGGDTSAIHDDEASEISAITEKASPVSADLILIEDSEAANAKKRVQIGNLPGGGASQLSDLSDVGVTTATNRNAMMADGDSWESRAITEADVSDLGSYQTSDADLTAIAALSCTEGQIIKRTAGGSWECSSDATGAGGDQLVDIVTTSPLTVNGGANVNDALPGSDADITFAMAAATNASPGHMTAAQVTALETVDTENEVEAMIFDSDNETFGGNIVVTGTLSAGAAGFSVDADGDTTVKSLNMAGSATPSIEVKDSDDAAGTGSLYFNSSGGANDIVASIGVEDSGGEDQSYIELDGVNETVDILQNATMSGTLNVTGQITGNLTGNVTGNASGTAATVTGAAQAAITSLGTLTTLTVDSITINGDTITGVAVGGLPDNIVDNGMMADNAVDSAEIASGAVDASHISTIVDSIAWNAGGMVADGTQCADPAKATINSGPADYTIICADNDASTMYGHVLMPDSWDGGTVTLELEYLQTAADTSALNADVAMQCRGAGETVSSTWGTEIAIDDAAVTGSNGVDHTTSAAVTPAGTCVGGDTLYWRVQLDATGTTTAVATLHFLGAKIEYTSNVGD